MHISNVDEAYRAAARAWPDRHGIQSHVTAEAHRKKNNGTSYLDHVPHQPRRSCSRARSGKLSAGKRVPGFAYAAPDAFVEGLLDAYFSGDGLGQKDGLHLGELALAPAARRNRAPPLPLWRRVQAQHRQPMEPRSVDDRGGRSAHASAARREHAHVLDPHARQRVSHLASHVSLVLDYKAARCAQVLRKGPKKRAKTVEPDLLNDVRLETIVEFKEVPSSHEFVYDLTVAQTRNMTVTNGLAAADTFHSGQRARPHTLLTRPALHAFRVADSVFSFSLAAGIASKNVTLGIPRIQELFSVSKAMKLPSLTIRCAARSGAPRPSPPPSPPPCPSPRSATWCRASRSSTTPIRAPRCWSRTAGCAS